MNLRVGLHHVDLVLEINWAVTLDLKLLGVGLADEAGFAHVDEFGEEFVLRGIDNWKRVDRNQDLITVAVDPHRVIVILVLIDGRRELDVDVFRHACWDHSLLLVPDLEVVCLWGKNMQSLGCRRIIYQSKFHRVGLVCLETSKFYHAW